MKRILTLTALLIGYATFSQVGINTTTPNPSSALDIESTSSGLLIPRMTQAQRDAITTPATGLMIFQTNNSPGFYYYNGSTWGNVSETTDADWFEVGGTTPPDNINDNLYTQGNVGIGQTTVSNGKLGITNDYSNSSSTVYLTSTGTGANTGSMYGFYNRLLVSSVVQARGLMNRFEGSDITRITGVRNEFLTTGTGSRYGMYNFFGSTGTPSYRAGIENSWTGGTASTNYGLANKSAPAYTISGNLYGTYNLFQSQGNGDRYGAYNSISGSGSGEKYGTYNSIPSTAGGTHYGVYSDVQNASGYAGYFLGRTYISGQVGVNFTNPTYAIHLPNNVSTSMGSGQAFGWDTYSDGRVKTNQEALKKGLVEILMLEPKSYFHHNSEFVDSTLTLKTEGENTIGFIAQELYNILPEAVQKPQNENISLWSVDYNKLVPVIVKAIQEMNTENEKLEKKIKSLETKLGQYILLEARLSALEEETNKVINTEGFTSENN
ncbi:tail fiber domain-containing protein [Marinirhabdus gelatinilytica]|uniref:tail fiber domain-containing protein n=1 Tax=Marinirhabdus gelatinilytica TaxID=1703343 RepID=UPI000E0FB3ED|nr:tail fiber domain-containing protein [Marinirhabdus gelatinilytica]